MIVWGPTLARALKSRERYKEVGLISFSSPTSSNAVSFAMRTDQLTDAGSQGGPLSQGCVANAPTAGAGWQRRPST